MQAYRNSREHVFAELHRIDVLLNMQIARQRRDPVYANFDQFRGVFISEEEIDLLTGDRLNKPEDTGAEDETRSQQAIVEQLEHDIAQKTVTALEQGIPLALPRLACLFQLTPFDIDALLICLAPELDLNYEKLYAYLHNDVARKRPSLDLILKVLCRSLEEKVQARARLLAEAPLMCHRLIICPSDGHTEQLSSLSRAVKIDERILHYLLDVETMDEQLSAFARCVSPSASLEALLLPADRKDSLVRFFQSQAVVPDDTKNKTGQVFVFYGPAGVGKKFTAEALCRSVHMNLLIADVPLLLSHSASDAALVSQLLREARLRSAAVYLDHAEVLQAENEKSSRAQQMLFRALEEFPGLTFIGSQQAWDSHAPLHSGSFIKIEFPTPDYAIRRHLWQLFVCDGGQRISSEITLDDIANTFNFTAGQIRNAIAEAKQCAMLRDPNAPILSADDLYQACRVQSSTKLTTLARKITPLYTWQDIILPNERLTQLKEICTHAQYRQRVFGEWGFNQKISLGKGLSMLFVGPSGTGKTMAAEIIAGELCLELYKIDLSRMVSKYIGETEKNLSKIFQEAEQSNAILFFDEADALFGKRSEVKDSHDRYANIEINYLLQKMEEYEGITILASNFQKNFDEAFTRRLRFIVGFPLPEEDYRYRMWKGMFPPDTPLGNDIDFNFLAKKLKLAGGNIKNIALNAAFLAAANSGVIDMEHLIRSTKREFQKMGRMCVKTDFEQYFDLVNEEA